MQKTVAYSEDAWRLDLLAPLAKRSQSTLVAYQLKYPHDDAGVPAQDQTNDLAGRMSRHSIGKRLDSISYTKARAQVRTSMKTLTRVLGKGHVKSYRVARITEGTSKQFAVAVSLSVSKATVLNGHLADMFDGLATGLCGNGGALIEGTQIIVKTHGKPILGAWEASRDDTGDLEFARTQKVPELMRTTVRFPDLTGGPRTTETLRD